MRESQYRKLKAELAALDERIAEAREKEMSAAIATCKDLIEQFGLTALDLGLIRTQVVATPKHISKTFTHKTPHVPLPPKYQDPRTGQTWSGRGKVPRWMADDERDDYLIKSA